MKLTLLDRALAYNAAFKGWPDSYMHCLTGRWIHGMWFLGNDYQGSMGFFGEYPPGYLKRVESMFPDAVSVLHLFSGAMSAEHVAREGKEVFRLDAMPKYAPDVVCDAETFSAVVLPQTFDVIYADPPYSGEAAEHYGKPMCNRNVVLSECAKVLNPGGFVVWLDQVLPMFRKEELKLCGAIGVVRSTNHRFRVVSLFEKV